MILLIITKLIGVALIGYILIISFRILVSWFRQAVDYKVFSTLCKLTDPYLSLFRNIRFLHTNNFDYSPLFGIALLIILSNIFMNIANTGIISLAIVLYIIVTTVSSSLFWILFFMIVLCLIRLFGIISKKFPGHLAWSYIDSILQPVLTPVLKFFNGKPAYKKLLIYGAFFLTTVLITGFVLVALLLYVIRLIPF